ncbi:hypothetical protein ISO99_06910 [Staphylococcus sp. 18_1_E_LY]|uniref:Uncharacterized protein n=1 Tax=Staphylococcus lloydii TaxID=2781774 RepID=A0A7T1F9U1_9STAP|nr:hypothetical protein [Staphylococcus lloydii]MBF7019641.1 hypothetical protein [Staphylococcus lloydii]MBF7027369.1 hypothetical protein [Staphylococcus lloydii]MDU9418996.1 hypothetical protein [Staphylococcus lloydii]QPM75031.1 hypothetical protein ISP08_12040 [Staphylococcus lloydii]
MNTQEIANHLEKVLSEANEIIERNKALELENRELRDLIDNQQDKLQSIYEETAKAQYNSTLWRKRFEAMEGFIAFKLEITPASSQYRNVAIKLREQLAKGLHEYY